MKRILVIILLIISVSLFAKIGLKGYYFGDTIYGDDYKYDTVAGQYGKISAYVDKENKIYMIGFTPTNLYGGERELYLWELLQFTEAVSKNYGVKLDYKCENDLCSSAVFTGRSGNIVVVIRVVYNVLTNTYGLEMVIADWNLYKKQENAEKLKNMADF